MVRSDCPQSVRLPIDNRLKPQIPINPFCETDFVAIRLTQLIAAAAFVLLLAPAGEPAVAAPNVSAFKLGNGLEVVVIPDRRTPVVTHMLWYKVGSADEPPGKSGIAHFLEHLLFKGTKKNPAGKFSQVVAGIGG